MPKVKNAMDHNNIMANRNRASGNMEYTLVIHKGKKAAFLTITEIQFAALKDQLDLKEEPSLTHEENKVYIIQ